METKISPISKHTIWKTFERTTKEGKVNKFWTQNLPEEHNELALSYFLEYFLKEQPVCRALKINESVESVNQICEIWRKLLNQNTTLACYTVDDDMKEILVGVNICLINSKSDAKPNYDNKTEQLRKLMALLGYLMNMTDVYQRFGVEKYLGSLGLLTHPEHRGYNIGYELLDSRKYLCKTLGIRLSVSPFGAPASQRLAEKAGFRDVHSASFDDVEAQNPSLMIPGNIFVKIWTSNSPSRYSQVQREISMGEIVKETHT